MVEYIFWGITLSKDSPTATWEMDLSRSEVEKVQYLIVRRVLLGDGVKDNELHFIQVEVTNAGNHFAIPFARLKSGSTDQCTVNLKFSGSPVNFKLLKGSGPVHIIGNHTFDYKINTIEAESDSEELDEIVNEEGEDDDDDEEEEELEEDDEDSDDEKSLAAAKARTPKQTKQPSVSAQVRANKRKIDNSEKIKDEEQNISTGRKRKDSNPMKGKKGKASGVSPPSKKKK